MFLGGLAAGIACSNASSDGIEWITYNARILEEARKNGQPVLLEFTADWCPPCEELEKHTFSDESVIEATRPFVAVRVDVTDYESAQSQQLRARFGITGVPEILFLNGRGEEIRPARVVGFVGPNDFVRRLQFAQAASNIRGRTAGD